jgi:hypothetical protein
VVVCVVSIIYTHKYVYICVYTYRYVLIYLCIYIYILLYLFYLFKFESSTTRTSKGGNVFVLSTSKGGQFLSILLVFSTNTGADISISRGDINILVSEGCKKLGRDRDIDGEVRPVGTIRLEYRSIGILTVKAHPFPSPSDATVIWPLWRSMIPTYIYSLYTYTNVYINVYTYIYIYT